MATPHHTETPLSAPDLIGPISITKQPVSGPRVGRRKRNQPFRHVHLELDLKNDVPDPTDRPASDAIAGLFRERKIVEPGTLVVLAAGALHALAARRFRRVDHWETSPGGWLPPPTRPEVPQDEEPVGHLIDALEGDSGQAVRLARSFSARVSDGSGNQVDLTVRRVHRERRHAISLDLWGNWPPSDVKTLKAAFTERLPVARTTMTKYQFIDS